MMLQDMAHPRAATLAATVIVALGAWTPIAAAQTEHPLLALLEQELAHQTSSLKTPDGTTPYFLQYTITDRRTCNVSAELGAVLNENAQQRRTLDVDLRCGDYTLDNTRQIRGRGGYGAFDRAGSTARQSAGERAVAVVGDACGLDGLHPREERRAQGVEGGSTRVPPGRLRPERRCPLGPDVRVSDLDGVERSGACCVPRSTGHGVEPGDRHDGGGVDAVGARRARHEEQREDGEATPHGRAPAWRRGAPRPRCPPRRG